MLEMENSMVLPGFTALEQRLWNVELHRHAARIRVTTKRGAAASERTSVPAFDGPFHDRARERRTKDKRAVDLVTPFAERMQTRAWCGRIFGFRVTQIGLGLLIVLARDDAGIEEIVRAIELTLGHAQIRARLACLGLRLPVVARSEIQQRLVALHLVARVHEDALDASVERREDARRRFVVPHEPAGNLRESRMRGCDRADAQSGGRIGVARQYAFTFHFPLRGVAFCPAGARVHAASVRLTRIGKAAR